MKTCHFFLTMWLIAAMYLPCSFAQEAGQSDQVIRIEKGEKARTLDIQLAHLDRARTEISILDPTGKPWLSHFVWDKDDYKGRFDLSQLPDGDYLLQVVNRKGHAARALNLQGPALTIFQKPDEFEKRFASYGPATEGRMIARIHSEDKVVKVQLANLRLQPTSIHIVSLDGTPVFTKNLREQNGYFMGINLDGLATGRYYLYIRNRDISIYQFLELDEQGVSLIGAVSTEDPSGPGLLFSNENRH